MNGASVVTWCETSDDAVVRVAPLISVLMIVYNHSDYLREAIEGIVKQKSHLPFELIIGEDGSSDESLAIALEYQQKFPQLIRVLHGGPNLGMNGNSRRVRAAARGEFLAWCEGDDYWCDTGKLEEQARVLLTRPEVGAVHTDWVRSRLREGNWEVNWSDTVHRRVPLALLQGRLLANFHNPVILRTCTLMFRKEIADRIDSSFFGRRNYDFGDAVTALFITSFWDVAYLPKVTAVYRLSPGSVLRSGVPARIRFLMSSLAFDTDARAHKPAGGRYPDAYRWEILVGLALWSVRGLDRSALFFSLRSLASDFTPLGFLKAALLTLWMRRRTPFARRPKARLSSDD